MHFEWDEAKRRRNLLKHGIDFVKAKEIWSRRHIEIDSSQKHHGEDRLLAIGESEGRVISVVFTRRGDVRRIISARSARHSEKENYQNEIG